MKKRIKIKWKNIIIILIMIICIIGLIISSINIIKWKIDNNNTLKQVNNINDLVEIKKTSDNENTEIIKQNILPEEINPYWQYIKMDMIYVDFSELKLINNNTKGWIQVNGTNINYPFVQADNNNYYLTHSFDKKYNKAGWVFLDYRNNIENINKNTILYAHGRIDTTMFGSLKNIIKSNWYNNSDNYIVKLSTEYQNSLWQVFSVYSVEETSDYLQIDFNNDEDYQIFLDKLKNRSVFDFNTIVSSSDNIITLSTCLNDTHRVVMHAKLIKKESR